MALAGCAQPTRPELTRFYRDLGPDSGQPPLVVIPGAFGSRLRQRATGREIWPGSNALLLFSSYENIEVGIDPDTLTPLAQEVEAYDVFRKGMGLDFYGRMLDALETYGGYSRLRPGELPAAPGRYYYVFPYDWRMDNVTSVQGLHRFLEQIADDHANPGLQVDLVGHSNGGLLARYYARFGTADVLDDLTARPARNGSPRIRRLLLVGTPNLGTMQPVLSHVRGEEIGFGRIPAHIIATCPGEPQLMPHPYLPWLYDHHGNPVDADVYDVETWRTLKWSIFDEAERARVISRHGGGRTGRTYLSMLEAFFEKHLARGRQFQLAMSRAAAEDEPLPHVFGGDCYPTVARLILERQGKRARAHEHGETLVAPEPGMDYDTLINDPGDGVVTRDSLMGRTGRGNAPPDMPIAHSVFLCEEHKRLTGNLSFQVNLLHTLLSAKAD